MDYRVDPSGGDVVPWHIEKRADEFCVISDASGDSVACLPSRPQAVRRLRDLFASDPDVIAAGFHDMTPAPMTPANVPAPVVAPVSDCPPGHHKMPNGQCMPDNDMPDTSLPQYSTAPWEGVLTVEGLESGDGRMFANGGLVWDITPSDGLPLMWQKETSHGGSGDKSVRVGRIAQVWREPDPAGRAGVSFIKGRGFIDLNNDDGAEAYRRFKAGFMSGNSVDVDSVKDSNIEFRYADSTTAADGTASPFPVMTKPELTIYNKGRIRGTTLVEYPAFTEARLSLMDDVTADAIMNMQPASPQHDTSISDGPWDGAVEERKLSSLVGWDVARDAYAWVNTGLVAAGDATTKSNLKLLHHEISDNGVAGSANLTACAVALATLHRTNDVPENDRRAVYDHLAAHLRDGGQTPPPFDVTSERFATLTAAGHVIELQDLPQRSWFQRPTDVTPQGAFTITDAGRVYGYLAPANVRHRSFPDAYTYAPLKKVDYDRFMGGETIVSDGGRVRTGPITMGCGHATVIRRLTADQAQEHYDNTCSVLASVAVGVDETGVWFAGALLPDVTPEMVQRAMACRLSGDWRAHLDRPGWRELTAALLVPVPGFPMARVAPSVQVEAGQLVSAAVPVRFIHEDEVTAQSDVSETDATTRKRLAFELTQRLGRDPKSQAQAVAARLGRDTTSRVEALRSRMFGTITEDVRKKAAADGDALPDGSYPIRNTSDLKNAIQAYGRSNPEDRTKVRRHIIKRARALGATSMIPESWHATATADMAVIKLEARMELLEFDLHKSVLEKVIG